MAHKTLSAIALSVFLALTAFGALAQALPTWRLSPQSEDLEPGLAVAPTAEATETLRLLTTILKTTITVSCTGASLDEALLEIEGKSSGKALFSGCQTLASGKPQEKCTAHTAGLANGTIRTNALKGQLISHEGATLEKLEPVAGTKEWADIEMSELCPFGEEVPVYGTVYLKDANGEFEVQAPTHTLEADPLTALYVISDTKEHLETSLDGKVKVGLSGAHAWREWNGVGS